MWVTQVLLSSAPLQKQSTILLQNPDFILVTDKGPEYNWPTLRIYPSENQVHFKSHYMNPPLVYNPYISSSGKTEITFELWHKNYVITNKIKTAAPTLWPEILVTWPAPLCPVLLPPYSPAKNALPQQRNRAEQPCARVSSEMGLPTCREVRGKRLYEAGEQKKVSAPLCGPFSTGKWSPLSSSPSPTATRMEDYKNGEITNFIHALNSSVPKSRCWINVVVSNSNTFGC